MERIKEALDRARSQRQETQVGKTPSPSPARPIAPTEGITYTQTRRIQPAAGALERQRVCTGDGKDPATRAFKMLRTQVLQRLTMNGWNALAITSPGPNQGKTLTAVNLAVALAREVSHTVLLVDVDFTRPAVHRYFNHTPEHGIVDYLLHDVPLNRILFNPGFDRLVVLPATGSLGSSSELLGSPKMRTLVEELKSRYPERIVLFDLPPVLSVDDALAFAPYVDAALLVVEENSTRRDELLRAVDLLQSTRLLGTVLNKSSQPISAAY